MNNTITSIKALVTNLLNDNLPQIEIEKTLQEIHKHFHEATEVTGFDTKIEHLAAVPTAKGKALGLNHAAQCLLDYKRTVKFLKAMFTAIKDKQTQHPGELITIFYAGCGPYAPFVNLIAPLFSADQIQFSVLEINESSLTVAKKLIETLELTEYVKDYYLADAVTFKVPNAESYHILFSETLDALLYRECYVPILFNMLPQFREDITLIPENVTVDASLLTSSSQIPNYKEDKLSNVVDARKAVKLHKGQAMPPKLEDVKIDFETINMEQYKVMLLDTKVQVYKDIWLDRNESSLTLPLEMEIVQPFQQKSITFTYQMEPDIELKCAMN